MLPLIMNGRLIQSAAQLRQHFNVPDMLRARRAFAQTAHVCIRPLSDKNRCASLLFSFTLLRMEGLFSDLDISHAALPASHSFNAQAFMQLHERVFSADNPLRALCDAFQDTAEQVLDDGAAILDWTIDVLNDLMAQCARAVLATSLSNSEKVDLFFLLVTGCLLADRYELPALSTQELTTAFQNLPPESAHGVPAFEALPKEGSLSLRQRETPYLLPTLTALPTGAVLRPLCIKGALHARGSTQYQVILHLKLTPEGEPLHEYVLSLHEHIYLTAVYVNDVPVAIVDAQRITKSATGAADVLAHPHQGRLLLRTDGTMDYSQYKNTAHRLFLQEIRDERIAEMLLRAGELIVLTDAGEVLSNTGREYAAAPVYSLSCLSLDKEVAP